MGKRPLPHSSRAWWMSEWQMPAYLMVIFTSWTSHDRLEESFLWCRGLLKCASSVGLGKGWWSSKRDGSYFKCTISTPRGPCAANGLPHPTTEVTDTTTPRSDPKSPRLVAHCTTFDGVQAQRSSTTHGCDALARHGGSCWIDQRRRSNFSCDVWKALLAQVSGAKRQPERQVERKKKGMTCATRVG